MYMLFGKTGKVQYLLELSHNRIFKRWSFLRKVLFRYIELKFCVSISEKAVIGESLNLPHPNSIVIGSNVKLGKNVTIYQNVTLGGARQGEGKYPSVGDNTIIYSGAVIIGDVHIGDNVVIGANSVVIDSVPNGFIAAGVPAKLIKRVSG